MKNKAMQEQNTHHEAAEELAQLSPLLSRIRQSEEVTEAPENYFRHMQQDVLWKLKSEQTAAKPAPAPDFWKRMIAIPGIFRQPVFAVGLAATVLVIAFALWRPAPPEAAETAASFASLTEAETLAYIENHLEDFDTDILAQTIAGNVSWISTSGMSEEEATRLLKEMLLEGNGESLDELL